MQRAHANTLRRHPPARCNSGRKCRFSWDAPSRLPLHSVAMTFAMQARRKTQPVRACGCVGGSEILEWKTNAEYAVVVVQMEMRGSDLKSAAKGEADSLGDVNFSNHQAGGEKRLLASTVNSAGKENRVRLKFGPQFLEHVNLRSVVPHDGSAEDIRMARGKADAERSLCIEAAESFSVSDRGNDHGRACAIGVRASRQAGAEECGEDVISALLVRAEQAVFYGERKIAKAVGNGRIVMRDVRRQIQQHFHILKGNQFEAFAAAVIFGSDAAVPGEPVDVVAEFLLEAR